MQPFWTSTAMKHTLPHWRVNDSTNFSVKCCLWEFLLLLPYNRSTWEVWQFILHNTSCIHPFPSDLNESYSEWQGCFCPFTSLKVLCCLINSSQLWKILWFFQWFQKLWMAPLHPQSLCYTSPASSSHIILLEPVWTLTFSVTSS